MCIFYVNYIILIIILSYNIIKYDISKYNYVYLYKDKLPVGDRSKLKSMFSKSVIREITDVKEILK